MGVLLDGAPLSSTLFLICPARHGLLSWRREVRDARAWQIVALSALLAWNVSQLSMGASLLPSLVALTSAMAAQIVATQLAGLPALDLRSPLITGLSLALLLRGDALWVPAFAAGIAIASKFLIRFKGKHLFNPAALAILALLQTGHAWVSPGQWGQSTVLVCAFVFLAILVLTRATRLDVALAFLAAFAALAFARASWLGDPMAIPLHQMQNGALLLFAFFMITDPRTTPDARPARLLFALLVATTAHFLLFVEQMRPALYVTLVAMSLLVPVLDMIFPAGRFVWRRSEEACP